MYKVHIHIQYVANIKYIWNQNFIEWWRTIREKKLLREVIMKKKIEKHWSKSISISSFPVFSLQALHRNYFVNVTYALHIAKANGQFLHKTRSSIYHSWSFLSSHTFLIPIMLNFLPYYLNPWYPISRRELMQKLGILVHLDCNHSLSCHHYNYNPSHLHFWPFYAISPLGQLSSLLV